MVTADADGHELSDGRHTPTISSSDVAAFGDAPMAEHVGQSGIVQGLAIGSSSARNDDATSTVNANCNSSLCIFYWLNDCPSENFDG